MSDPGVELRNLFLSDEDQSPSPIPSLANSPPSPVREEKEDSGSDSDISEVFQYQAPRRVRVREPHSIYPITHRRPQKEHDDVDMNEINEEDEPRLIVKLDRWGNIVNEDISTGDEVNEDEDYVDLEGDIGRNEVEVDGGSLSSEAGDNLVLNPFDPVLPPLEPVWVMTDSSDEDVDESNQNQPSTSSSMEHRNAVAGPSRAHQSPHKASLSYSREPELESVGKSIDESDPFRIVVTKDSVRLPLPKDFSLPKPHNSSPTFIRHQAREGEHVHRSPLPRPTHESRGHAFFKRSQQPAPTVKKRDKGAAEVVRFKRYTAPTTEVPSASELPSRRSAKPYVGLSVREKVVNATLAGRTPTAGMNEPVISERVKEKQREGMYERDEVVKDPLSQIFDEDDLMNVDGYEEYQPYKISLPPSRLTECNDDNHVFNTSLSLSQNATPDLVPPPPASSVDDTESREKALFYPPEMSEGRVREILRALDEDFDDERPPVQNAPLADYHHQHRDEPYHIFPPPEPGLLAVNHYPLTNHRSPRVKKRVPIKLSSASSTNAASTPTV